MFAQGKLVADKKERRCELHIVDQVKKYQAKLLKQLVKLQNQKKQKELLKRKE